VWIDGWVWEINILCGLKQFFDKLKYPSYLGSYFPKIKEKTLRKT
jgi:hypothetical protein